MKNTRQEAILEIIENEAIQTQEELAEHLRQRGIVATQATISRDVKDLGLEKIPNSGVFRYVALPKPDFALMERLTRVFADTVLSVADAQNLIVVKTLSGSAHAASEVIDLLAWPEILGTLAGDNTFLIIVRTVTEVPEIRARLQALRTCSFS